MREVSMLEFRQNAESILERVKRGERLILTYRGRAAVRLEPLGVADAEAPADDPLFALKGSIQDESGPLDNAAIDHLIYG